jgi:hypothetical protein
VTSLRQLLLALLLPVLVLPDGVLVCLCRLVGEPPAKSCCVRKHCCSNEGRRPSTPSFSAPARSDCCLAIPENDRSFGPSISKSPSALGEELAARDVAVVPVAIVPEFVQHPTRGPSAWSHHDPPVCATVPLVLPLRL